MLRRFFHSPAGAYLLGQLLATVLFVALLALLGSCTLFNPHYRPRPPRHPTLRQATHYVERLNTVKYQNRRYYPVRPR